MTPERPPLMAGGAAVAGTSSSSSVDACIPWVTLGECSAYQCIRVLTAGTGITLTDNAGAHTVTVAAASGDACVPWVTLGECAAFQCIRVLTAGTNITITDSPAAHTVTIAASGGSAHTIATEGQALTSRSTLDFCGRFVTVDDCTSTTRVRIMDHRTMAVVKDDFIGGNGVNGDVGETGWAITNVGNSTNVAGEIGHPGIFRVATGSSGQAATAATVIHKNSAAGPLHSFDCFEAWFVVRVNDNDTNAGYRVGFWDATSAARGAGGASGTYPVSGIYIEKRPGDTDWSPVTTSASTCTRGTTLGSVDLNWTCFRIRRIDSSTVGFTKELNGAECTLTSNIPSTALLQAVQAWNNQVAADKRIDVDYADLVITSLRRTVK